MSKCGLPSRRKVRCNLQPELQYKTLFFEIIDIIVMQIKQRFKSVKDIEFVGLLDCKRFHQYENIPVTKFPERSFQSLQISYSSHFDFACLRTELAVLYSHNHFRKNNVRELHKYMHEGQLYEGFREVSKLILLFLTIPYSTASIERSFSALKRIKTYLRNAQGQNRLSNLPLMSIEKANEYLSFL